MEYPYKQRGSEDSREVLSAKTRAEAFTRTVLGGFMVTFLVAGFGLALWSPGTLTAPQAKLLNGEWANQYQENFEEDFLLRGAAEMLWGGLSYGLFAEGRRGVVLGADGWLFSREEFAAFSDETLLENLEHISAVRDYLATQNIQLVVALVPAKARIYAEQLKRPLPPAQLERYDNVLANLRERNILTPDLRPSLMPENDATYLRTDTHWTPHGAQRVAMTLAEEVARVHPFDALGETEFVTESLDAELLRGDLYAFLGLGNLAAAMGPELDVLTVTQTSKVSSSADLFADPDIPVALVGTSYSADERWNFAGALKEQLGADVLNAAEQGDGPFAPMAAYLSSAAFENTKPELVIWELPERQVTQTYELEPPPTTEVKP